MFETWTLHGLPPLTLEHGRVTKSWQQMYWMNDKSQFDGATVDQLREHFRGWAASQKLRGQITWPETYMFMVVDKDVLDNIRPQNPELDFLPRNEDPYLKAFDRYYPNEGEDYPGWMKVDLVSLFDVYRKGLNLESMRGLRFRHSDWFRCQVREEDTFLEEEDDQSSLDWGSDPRAGYNTSEV